MLRFPHIVLLKRDVAHPDAISAQLRLHSMVHFVFKRGVGT